VNVLHDDLGGLYLAGTGTQYGHIDDQAQTIAGAKTFVDGLYLGATGTLLSQYMATDLSGNTTLPFAGSITAHIERLGDVVTMSISDCLGDATTNGVMSFDVLVPAAYLPAAGKTFIVHTKDQAVVTVGTMSLIMTSGFEGTISIIPGFSGQFTYNPLFTSCGVYATTVSWLNFL
jgi:hypothetical protein